MQLQHLESETSMQDPSPQLQYDLYITYSVTTETDLTCSLFRPYSMTQNQACIIEWQ